MKSQKGEFSEKIEIRQGEYGLLGFSFYSSYLKIVSIKTIVLLK